MIPEDGRQQLAGGHRRQVTDGRARPQAGPHDEHDDGDRVDRLDHRRHLLARPGLVGDGARGEVVRRRDRGADRAKDRQPRPPRFEAADRHRHGRCRGQHGEGHPDRDPASAEGRPDEQDRGLELDDRPDRDRDAQSGRPVHPAPAGREAQEQERTDLAELDAVHERPGEAGEEDDEPADIARHRKHRDAEAERDQDGDRPARDLVRVRQQGERHGEQREWGRIEVLARRTSLVDRGVIDGLAAEQAMSGVEVGVGVVADRGARAGQHGHDHEDGHRQCDDRQQSGPNCPAAAVRQPVRGHRRRRTPRWRNGIRNRSQATRSARPGRVCIREPRRSNHWIGTIAMR